MSTAAEKAGTVNKRNKPTVIHIENDYQKYILSPEWTAWVQCPEVMQDTRSILSPLEQPKSAIFISCVW